ncbi:hypothetical protein [Lacisediminihabitans profunda]|uniref:Uncharacterized protein n=1 Tax=Lacisediminihabitans profunda TaxID=2594790 RepID=A0A5C8URS1_9MICO|nr:hypothetical protein [Lacisediminihabitans profunda]TXN31281.1 hypothetical protein FVP33_06850 [Lacisediminihabitans profunda]
MTTHSLPDLDDAYPVPFRLDRDTGPRRYLLTNAGTEPVDGVTVSLLGSGMMPASLPATLLPGESLEVMVSGRDLARCTVLVVRWFRPNGREYLWRVSF